MLRVPSNKLYLPMEGNANDASGNGNDGVVTGATLVAGQKGKCYSFDGINDDIDIANSISGVYTIAFWAKPATTTQKLLQISTNKSIWLGGGVLKNYGLDSPTVYIDGVQTTTFPDTNWHFVTVITSIPVIANDINVGVEGLNSGNCLYCNALYSASAANGTIHDLTTQDLGIAAWVKADSTGSGIDGILAKYSSTEGKGYLFEIQSAGKLEIFIRDGGNSFKVTGNTNLRDNTWHHVAGIIDRNNVNNCAVYVDGIFDGNTPTGVLANVGSITALATMALAKYFVNSSDYIWDGRIRDVVLAYPTDIMASGEMGAAGKIAYMANHPFDKTNYCNYEDYWACTEGSGTTITGDVNNLTLSNALAWNVDKIYGNTLIDEVMVFNKSLSVQSIKRLMLGLHPLE